VPFWELADFPAEWVAAFDGVDEIWAPTRFIQAALSTRVEKPILHMPLALEFSADADFKRSHYGLPPKKFIFLFSFDFLSFSGRKNPVAVIEAFVMAFSGRPHLHDVTLVIKCVNTRQRNADFEALLHSINRDLDIRIMDKELTRQEMLGLIQSVDCVISLHRSEGLGLLIAEAMALGVPVISTNYSATTELVSAETGYPVDYRLIEIGENEYPMAYGQCWADPDVAHAAWQMVTVVEESGSNAGLLSKASDHLRERFGARTVRRMHDERFKEIGL
jgi:glycosyltransferase involved in cell wall biosynthesis